ncbi:homogentisate 1,2-dioxygenase [Rhodococcus sp. NPDC056960]|uniref:homogentisate 1,2-dioxygenase n=1 Tax=Rhodococcus TaxID=1827 RepID=UPI003627B8D7
MRTLIQHSKGQTSRQAHRNLGDLRDDELGRGGFDGRQAVLYRRNDPTVFRGEGRFRSSSFPSLDLKTDDLSDARGWPARLFFNDDVTVWLTRRAESMPFVRRNVDGDECWFIHVGTGVVETEFGPVEFGPGDYVVIPKAVTHRWVITSGPIHALGIETVGELRAPTYTGLGRQAPFDPDVVRVPEPCETQLVGGEVELQVKYDGEYSTLMLSNHPFDVAGWKGDYFPLAFNIRDWNVIMSDTLHLPPSMHVFLIAEGVNIINLLPRPFESVEGVERIPWYHRNADYDEIAFIHGGDALGRPLVKGQISHDPQGIHHGFPQRARDKSRREWDNHPRINWQVIMLESRRPLRLDPGLLSTDLLQ